MTAIEWDTEQHVDVVCPPDPDAFCRHCGNTLADHQTTDPDNVPTPGDAACVDDMGPAFWDRRLPRQFELADGERLDCPDAAGCGVCDVYLCSEHTSNFTTCAANSAVLHHLNCRHTCPDCDDAAQDDARSRA